MRNVTLAFCMIKFKRLLKKNDIHGTNSLSVKKAFVSVERVST